MAEFVLETKGLGISFGGLKAAQDVNIRIKKNQIYGLIGPNGAGKTTIFNLLTCVYKPTVGTFYLDGEEMKGLSPEKINQKGIARTFQNIRLFNNMTVVRNVMVGLHNQPQYRCSFWESVFRLPRHFKVEKEMREKAKELLLEESESIGSIGSIIAQFGDLFASSIKRYVGIKDYGKLIPGHGGILDRFDSVILVAPFVYYAIFLFM